MPFFQKSVVAALLFISALFALAAAVPVEGARFEARTNTGQATYYIPGLGACGKTSQSTDYVVGVSKLLYDTYPGHTANPNNNPICGHKIQANYAGKSVTAIVVDRCEGCARNDLDFSPSAFQALAPLSAGRLNGVTWSWA
ncbi:hypothetical protein BOTBODRAFT_31621 [Botryobasidium botryosum FD-172 SS1]|uniref:RlpA-like protein double-psi beta-barrel domain-containing protein n=1 Tax=Botryobasidium botryosum (strain FD-172 SS1) TaxID=930990 RepID=A0A067MV36_BOTB1|nr:hypothetical protein BOTBODRAFT_31621 [Botryobasidium botryosum FD-172 SS1]